MHSALNYILYGDTALSTPTPEQPLLQLLARPASELVALKHPLLETTDQPLKHFTSIAQLLAKTPAMGSRTTNIAPRTREASSTNGIIYTKQESHRKVFLRGKKLIKQIYVYIYIYGTYPQVLYRHIDHWHCCDFSPLGWSSFSSPGFQPRVDPSKCPSQIQSRCAEPPILPAQPEANRGQQQTHEAN